MLKKKEEPVLSSAVNLLGGLKEFTLSGAHFLFHKLKCWGWIIVKVPSEVKN